MFVFPPEFDAEFYRGAYPDLRSFTDVQLEAHYRRYGANEGRLPNRFRNRNELVKELSSSASTLEIGPFFSPIAVGVNVKYFDVLSQEKLLESVREHHEGLDSFRSMRRMEARRRKASAL
jgi:hypothetical protein